VPGREVALGDSLLSRNSPTLELYRNKYLVRLLVCFNKMVFTSETHLYFYLMYYSCNMFRLAIESSSGPYIKIQILIFFYSKCVMGSPNTYLLFISVHYGYQYLTSIILVEYTVSLFV
jgi:hypothetical protein